MTNRRGTITTGLRTGAVLACLALMPLGAALAQPTNLETYQRLALRCLTEAPDTVQAFRLEAPAQMPYLRTALTQRWREEGRVLFLADSLGERPATARLRYEIEEARVAYARARRKQLARTVTLALRYTFTAADGRLLREDRCRDTITDTIRRSDRAALEWETFPETLGEDPRGGWMRRYLEPAILAVATAVTIYLFFNIRSQRTNNGV